MNNKNKNKKEVTSEDVQPSKFDWLFEKVIIVIAVIFIWGVVLMAIFLTWLSRMKVRGSI